MTVEEELKLCVNEWIDKTNWVQDTAHWSELGMHRADVIKQRFYQKEEEIAELKRLLLNSELVLDATKEELTKQTNRAAIAEQELTAMSFRLTMCNKMKSQAEKELADLKMKGVKND